MTQKISEIFNNLLNIYIYNKIYIKHSHIIIDTYVHTYIRTNTHTHTYVYIIL